MQDTPRSFQPLARERGAYRAVHPLGLASPRASRTYERSYEMQGNHPDLVPTHVRCSACGNEFTTRSVRDELVLEVCAKIGRAHV